MIFVTGDIHGEKERFQAVKKARCKKGDTLICCGDFGFIWSGEKKEKKLLEWIGKRKHYTLFVEGCNENHTLLAEYPIVDFMGGRARQISGKLYQLLRGEVYEIEGKRVFSMGGGDPGEDFAAFQDEKVLLPSAEELENARRNLERVENRVDLIVTHDAPIKIREFIDMDNREEITQLHAFLEELTRSVSFKRWYMGKYHLNRTIPPRYYMVFTQILKYEG